jgi:hypothetical protein
MMFLLRVPLPVVFAKSSISELFGEVVIVE